MVKFDLMKPALKIQRKKINLLINIILGLWITAILCLQIILYPPQPVINILTSSNLSEPFYTLQGKILPTFQTSDLNIEFALKFND